VGNYFRNSGEDQDLDMEPSGGPQDKGPYDVVIDQNVFERLKPKTTVTLGSAGGVQRARGIRFTNNTIRASPLAVPPTVEGECLFVYTAQQITIAHNTIIGAQSCVTIAAQKVTDLVVEQNHLESFANMHDHTGTFAPQAVIDVSERVVQQCAKTPCECGQPHQPPCRYAIHYSDRITVRGNTIKQHVPHSPGVLLKYVDASGVDPDPYGVQDNSIEATNTMAPVGPVDSSVRAMGIAVQFGVPPWPKDGVLKGGRRTVFQKLSISGNRVSQFADGVKILHTGKMGVQVTSSVLTANVFHTNLTPSDTPPDGRPHGIEIADAVKAPHTGFMIKLRVENNQFGCGFPPGPPPRSDVPPQAYVHPKGQAHTGTIGVLIPCQAPGDGPQRGTENARPHGEAEEARRPSAE
jgi:hypothetical protein